MLPSQALLLLCHLDHDLVIIMIIYIPLEYYFNQSQLLSV